MPKALSTFSVDKFEPQQLRLEVKTACDVSYILMEKTYSGDLEGRSETLFFGALQPTEQSGTYVAIENVTAALGDKIGTFNIAHSSTMVNQEVTQCFLTIVPASATGALEGLRGSGSIAIDPDGTHRLLLDYEL